MTCDGEQGWRFIAASITLRRHVVDEAARAAAAEDIAELWRAFDDGDEAVERFLLDRKQPHIMRGGEEHTPLGQSWARRS